MPYLPLNVPASLGGVGKVPLRCLPHPALRAPSLVRVPDDEPGCNEEARYPERVATPLSEPYRLTRSQVAFWGAREYVRRLWWAFVAIPLSGVLLLIFAQHPVMQVIGFMSIIWPLTIPARSTLATRGAARRLTLPTRLLRDDEYLYFATEPRDRSFRARLDAVRSATVRSDALAIEIGPLRFVFVPVRALGGPREAELLAASLTLESPVPTGSSQ